MLQKLKGTRPSEVHESMVSPSLELKRVVAIAASEGVGGMKREFCKLKKKVKIF